MAFTRSAFDKTSGFNPKLLVAEDDDFTWALRKQGIMSATVADATQWDFSYVDTVGTISGRIDGTLQGDANTIFVSSLSGLQFNGTPGPALPFLVSATTALSGIPVPLTLSLDGSANDIIACSTDTTSLGCSDDGFAFAPVGFLVPVFASGPAY